jgi:hypothetical protein
MAADFTTTELVASVKRRSFLPANDETLTDADILAILDEEMRLYILPFIRECNEELLIRRYDVTPPSDGRIRVGTRFGLESVKAVYGTTDGTNYTQLMRVEPEQAPHQTLGANGIGGCFWYFEDDFVCLASTPTPFTTIRLTYYLRPNKLVPVEECALVTAIGSPGEDGTNVSLSNYIVALQDADDVDIVDAAPGLRILQMDAVQTYQDDTTTQIASLSSSVAAGDYVCLVGESCVPNIPADLVPLLTQRAVVVCLGGKNDVALDQQTQRLMQMEAAARSAFTVRSQGTPRYVRGPMDAGNRRWLGRSWWGV